jgi:hypothetical protein
MVHESRRGLVSRRVRLISLDDMPVGIFFHAKEELESPR